LEDFSEAIHAVSAAPDSMSREDAIDEHCQRRGHPDLFMPLLRRFYAMEAMYTSPELEPWVRWAGSTGAPTRCPTPTSPYSMPPVPRPSRWCRGRIASRCGLAKAQPKPIPSAGWASSPKPSLEWCGDCEGHPPTRTAGGAPEEPSACSPSRRRATGCANRISAARTSVRGVEPAAVEISF
jgi:hypothetical protein